MDGILEALDGAGGVEPVAEAVGDGLVGLLDVGEHLGVELGLEVGGGRHEGGGVGVLGFEVGDDFGRVLVAHPAVVVVEGDAVERGGRGVAAGDGRLGVDGWSMRWERWGGTFRGETPAVMGWRGCVRWCAMRKKRIATCEPMRIG